MAYDRSAPIVTGLHLTVSTGAVVSLTAPSGAGKTTLLRIIAGLEQDYIGEITLDGVLLSTPSPDVHLLHQGFPTFPWMTVFENVSFGLSRDDSESRSKVFTALTEAGLQEKAHAFPQFLSGGEHSRVAIARVLAAPPRLLLLDEPFQDLDLRTRATVRDALLRVWRDTGMTILLVTHDIEEAVLLSDVIYWFESLNQPPQSYSIPLQRPRTYTDAAELSATIRQHISDKVKTAVTHG